MPQKLYHKKKAYYSCARDCPDLLLEDPPLSRRQKQETTKLSPQTTKDTGLSRYPQILHQKKRKISDKSAEPVELQRRGKEGRKRSLRRPTRTQTTPTFTARTPSCAHTKLLRRSLCPVPAIATAGTSSKGGRIQIPKPDGLSIRTSHRTQISKPCLPLDQDLGPDPDFPNLPAFRSGPRAGFRFPKPSGLSIRTLGLDPGSQTFWPLDHDIMSHDLGLDPGSETFWPLDHDLRLDPDSQTFWSLDQDLRSDPECQTFPPLSIRRTSSQIEGPNPDSQKKLTSRSGPHSLSSNKEYKGFFLERNLSKSPYFEEKKV